MRLNALIIISAGIALAGCESISNSTKQVADPTYEQAAANSFRTVNYAAADALLSNYAGPASVSNKYDGKAGAPFVVATLVNIDQLEQSSTLGRAVSEQISSRLTQTGKLVVDLKVGNSVYMRKSEGEFLLTREIKEVAATHRAQAVIVGTYALSASFVQITLKLVDPSNSLILAAHDYTLPLDKEVKSMLRKTSSF